MATILRISIALMAAGLSLARPRRRGDVETSSYAQLLRELRRIGEENVDRPRLSVVPAIGPRIVGTTDSTVVHLDTRRRHRSGDPNPPPLTA
ncbi:MAG: hypothetical protein JJLCMIEE_00889 [Acidimicrobiales bacterium]|nr:hypothetical protein [Acidimicrobiales bacterium]